MIGSPAFRIRAVSAALALVAGVGLLAYEPANLPASAADEGQLTDSAVTLRWSDGVTGADNQTVIEQRDTADVRYSDFDGLEVTVSQTENIRAQALGVTWSGWNPSPPTLSTTQYANVLQVMQCWAEDDSGPTPETCVWASAGMNPPTDRRIDTDDPRGGEVTDRLVDGQFPFQSANGGDPVINQDLPFDRWTTNEVPAAKTDGTGGGELYFTAQDGIDAPHLGCGLTGDDGEPRDCWLVIVPRGSLDFVGGTIGEGNGSALERLNNSLTPSHWENRMQVRLDFEQVDSFCPADREQRLTVGSQLIAEAMYSWQPVLCAGDGAVYGYAPTADSEGRFQLLANIPGSAGLAFTSAPVVSDDDELDLHHAPVAVSGAAIAFNIDEQDRTIVRDLRLTPRLVAKLLTQSYLQDLPGDGSAGVGNQSTQWWGGDTSIAMPPLNIMADPEYLELNDIDTTSAQSASRFGGVKVRVAAGSADAVRELWRWVQADPEAVAWLAGEPDEWGMVINPYFEDLNLEEPPAIDTVPRDVDRCFLQHQDVREPGLCSLDVMPYTNGFEGSAREARLASTGGFEGWDSTATAPDGSLGWWARTSPQPPGVRYVLAITDTASAARYGLPTAALQNAAGEFVAPTDASLTAGIEAMVPSEVDGVLAIDPEAEAPEAYPLTMIAYAAIRGSEEPDALADYAEFLEYAAGEGQVPGVAVGQLPAGYVPLTDELRAQALAVAEDLVTPDDPNDPPDLTPNGDDDPGDEDPPGGDDGSADGTESGGDESGGDASGGPGSDPAGNGLPGGNDAPDPVGLQPNGNGDAPDDGVPPADGAAGGGPEDPLPPGVDDADPVAHATPGEPVGPMQYALLVVLIVGLVGALGGPALLKLGPHHA